MKLLIIFIVLNVVNVILQTVKSLCTIKCGKVKAALINAIAFGLYTVVLVYMSCDLSTGVKAIVVALCNLIGVYIVKTFEEKIKKSKIWKIEFCTKKENYETVVALCKQQGLSFNAIEWISGEKYVTFNMFCPTQEYTKLAQEIIKKVDGKYFITESKSF